MKVRNQKDHRNNVNAFLMLHKVPHLFLLLSFLSPPVAIYAAKETELPENNSTLTPTSSSSEKRHQELGTEKDGNGENFNNISDNQESDAVREKTEDGQSIMAENEEEDKITSMNEQEDEITLKNEEENEISPYIIAGIIVCVAFIASTMSVFGFLARNRRKKNKEVVKRVKGGMEIPMNSTPDEDDGIIISTHVQTGLIEEIPYVGDDFLIEHDQLVYEATPGKDDGIINSTHVQTELIDEIPYNGDDSLMEHDQLVYEAVSKASDIDIVYTLPDEENDEEHNGDCELILGTTASPFPDIPPRNRQQDYEGIGEDLFDAAASAFAALSTSLSATNCTIHDLEKEQYLTESEDVMTGAKDAQQQQLQLNANDYPLSFRYSGHHQEQLSVTAEPSRSPSQFVTRNFSLRKVTSPPVVRRIVPASESSVGGDFVGGSDSGDVELVDGVESLFSNRPLKTLVSTASPVRQQPQPTRHRDPALTYEDTACNKLDNVSLTESWDDDEDAPSGENSC